MTAQTFEDGVSQIELWHELMQFYINEAWLLDDRKFREWLDLFTDDVFYFMPRRLNVGRHDLDREVSEVGDLALVEDDKTYMTMRVDRLDTGMAWAEDPPSRTRHIITNIEVEAGDSQDELKVYSNFFMYRTRAETEQDFYIGSREDVLRRVNGQLRVASRKIVLDQTVLLAKNLSNFF